MASQEKIDLFKLHRREYSAPKKPLFLEISEARYLSLAGSGEPGSDPFQIGVGTLYTLAYTLKFGSKAAGRDYAVCKLEALWWADGEESLQEVPRDQWRWKLMIRLPDFIAEKALGKAVAVLEEKGKAPGCETARIETLTEGFCVQMLHVGPYEKEGETLTLMQEAAQEKGLSFRDWHHEIYLSDPRRVEAERLRTILRHPVG